MELPQVAEGAQPTIRRALDKLEQESGRDLGIPQRTMSLPEVQPQVPGQRIEMISPQIGQQSP